MKTFPSVRSILSVELVPMPIALVYGRRFFIGFKQGDRHYVHRTIQLTELEAELVLRVVSKLAWQLDEVGIPRGIQAIDRYIAAAIGGEA